MKKSIEQRAPAVRPVRIVALGGGTGLSTVLRGLKEHVAKRGKGGVRLPISDLAAVVTVTDDGGSSGRLRREYRILPPGDIRNCMVALSKDEALLGRLFQYRFHAGRGLRGHNFGNLFLAALTHVTGDFFEAIRVTSRVLAIRGRIFPSTLSNVHLVATLESGRIVHGETRITASRSPIDKIALSPRRVRPLATAVEAIEEADLILLG
ncbi:MAG TPA: gluconeogenesis factor YvcK family protein, partial [Candidatus Sulfotelmatobacter sp.]|nr:gluconeogenesis factor YvcK family protein [Candidatus Sulfotelmatobacter sp.]